MNSSCNCIPKASDLAISKAKDILSSAVPDIPRQVKTVKVGFFKNRQPNSDIVEVDGVKKVVGTDISLAFNLFHRRLGYAVEFYEVTTTNVGLYQLQCGLLDVIASSTVNITPARRNFSNYLVVDAAPSFPLEAIYSKCLGNILSLKDIWIAIGGHGVYPQSSPFRFATGAPGTVQSNAVRLALKEAYPSAGDTILTAFFNQHTINTTEYTQQEFIAGFLDGSYQAGLFGPRGDNHQMGVIHDSLNPENYAVLEHAAMIPDTNRGWAIRSCKLMIEAQYALDAAIADGTYASLQSQVQYYPYFAENCLKAGLGASHGVAPPSRLYSITSGAVNPECIERICEYRPVLMTPEKMGTIREFPITGHIYCLNNLDCDSCKIVQ